MKNKGKKLIIAVLAVLMLLPSVIFAGEGGTLEENGTLLTGETGIKEVPIDLTNGHLTIDDGNTVEEFDLNDSGSKYQYGSKFLLEEGKTYAFLYKDAITEGGNKYSVKVTISDVTIKDRARYSEDYEYIRIEDGTRGGAKGALQRGLLSVGSEYTCKKDDSITWPETWEHTTDYVVDQRFLDSDGNETHLDFYVCIQDIDQAHYEFDASGREIFYTDGYGQSSWNKDEKASQNMFLSDKGLKRDITKGYNESDGYGGFEEAMVYIPLHDSETGLTTTVRGWGDVCRYPRVFILRKADYKVEYYYQTEDAEGAGIFDDDGKPVYPDTPESGVTRNGVVDTTVSVTEDDKKPADDKAERYVLDEAMNADYSGVVLEDGSLELKVYFKRTFTVIYNDGVADEVVFDDQVTKKIPYNEDTPKFNGGVDPERKGYEFIGWKPTVEDKVTKDAYYEAQWDPWKYYIRYEPNGGKGEMEKQTFVYSDKTFDSTPNKFTRDGYRFVGFLYVDKDEKRHILQQDDFRDELVNKWGKEQTIVLIAQWEKLPDKPVYSAPVTGVE